MRTYNTNEVLVTEWEQPMHPQTDKQCHAIVARLSSGVHTKGIGSVLLELLPVLIPILIDCFDPDDGAQAQDYVTQRWDANNGYDRRMHRTTARQAKKAARQKRQRITWSQAMEVAEATLDQIRQGDPQELSLTIREHD